MLYVSPDLVKLCLTDGAACRDRVPCRTHDFARNATAVLARCWSLIVSPGAALPMGRRDRCVVRPI